MLSEDDVGNAAGELWLELRTGSPIVAAGLGIDTRGDHERQPVAPDRRLDFLRFRGADDPEPTSISRPARTLAGTRPRHDHRRRDAARRSRSGALQNGPYRAPGPDGSAVLSAGGAL